jgi:hypothetical protein
MELTTTAVSSSSSSSSSSQNMALTVTDSPMMMDAQLLNYFVCYSYAENIQDQITDWCNNSFSEAELKVKLQNLRSVMNEQHISAFTNSDTVKKYAKELAIHFQQNQLTVRIPLTGSAENESLVLLHTSSNFMLHRT